MSEQDLFYLNYSIIAQIFAAIVFFIIHILYFRSMNVEKILRVTLYHGIIAGVIVFFIGGLFLDFEYSLTFIKIINFILFCTFIFIYASMGPIMADRSLSIFLLILINEGKDNTASISYLKKRLDCNDMFNKRFVEHQKVGAISRNLDLLTVTKQGRRIAMIYLYMIKLLRLKKNY